jgi:hypothetical protein
MAGVAVAVVPDGDLRAGKGGKQGVSDAIRTILHEVKLLSLSAQG